MQSRGASRPWGVHAALTVAGLAVGIRVVAAPIEVLREPFDRAPAHPCLMLKAPARTDGGLLRNASQAGWLRSGLEIGPLPTGKAAVTLTYDFRPVRFGNQGQSFVSQTPSTHWYMLYAGRDGKLSLHTRQANEWKLRGRSTEALQLGTWYRARIDLAHDAIRAVISERDTAKAVWDSQAVPLDSTGETTLCMLTDETPGADEAETDWDNLVVSTEDAVLAAQFAADAKRLAAEKARREREEKAAADLAADLRQRGLALIPVPQQVRFQKGTYALTEAKLAFAAGQEDAARCVQAILHEQTGCNLALDPGGRRGIVLRLTRAGDWPAATTRPSEGYHLEVTRRGIGIEARDRAGFIAAAHTLAQLARDRHAVPCGEITDWPAIENRVVMIAVSQGGFHVIDVDYWKRVLRELAAVKINMVMPYFEGGTYYYEKYPFMGIKGRDGFTGDKGRELSRYAWEHGIEITPQQQTLGHAGNMLGHKELSSLRESGGVFCSSKPEVFSFLDDLFDELTAAFPNARYLHGGGDEFLSGFAKCDACVARAAEIGKDGVYAMHMMRVRDLLAQRRRQLMIWWHEEGFTESAADRLAKDIVVFDWHYGNQSSYPSIARLTKLGFPVWATPAVTRYYSGTNDFHNTFGNIRGFLAAAAAAGLPGECTCTWVHGIWGGRNLFELNLYALVYSAQCAWKPANADEEDFRGRFARHWFGLSGDGAGEEVLHAWHAPFGETKEQGFWASCRDAEPRLAAAPAATLDDLAAQPAMAEEAAQLMAFCTRARAVLEGWQGRVTRNQTTVDFLLHDVHIYETLCRRLALFGDLPRLYAEARTAPAERRAAARALVVGRLETLIDDHRQIEAMFDRSIREAGGARCGKGSFSGGEIQFRAPQGRAALEELLARLKALPAAGDWPEKVW